MNMLKGINDIESLGIWIHMHRFSLLALALAVCAFGLGIQALINPSDSTFMNIFVAYFMPGITAVLLAIKGFRKKTTPRKAG